MRRRVISFWDALLPVFLCWQYNLEYLWFIWIGKTHMWAQNMKWWHWLRRILWEGQMCLVQPSSLYHFYLHVYAFIISTLTLTYIKTTTVGHHQSLLLQIEQNISTSLLLPDTPGQSRQTLPNFQEYIRMSLWCWRYIHWRLLWTAEKRYCSGNEKCIKEGGFWWGYT